MSTTTHKENPTSTNSANAKSDDKVPVAFLLLAVIVVFIGVVIAIPIVYSTGRNQGLLDNQVLSNVSEKFTINECTSPSTVVEALVYIENQEPFPFIRFNRLYRPSVILKRIDLMFAFRHDTRSWAIDQITVNDTTNGELIFKDGGFESNYLNKNYRRCVLSDTRSSTGDILFDNPYEGDFYYNDETTFGTAYLIQSLDIIGGRYYNITFFLENRGYRNNAFLLLIGFVKKK